MRRELHLRPAAELELQEAYEWYEGQQFGLGGRFLLAFDATIERVRRHPGSRGLFARATRRAFLRRFPWFFLYICDGPDIVITAVSRTRRDPRSWSGRVREAVPYGAVYAIA